eukprot:gene3432-3063_t
MFSATTLSRFAVLAAVFLAQSHVDACGALPQCKTFREIYGGGKQLCENMWGDAFKYETNEDEGFVMWWDSGSNPNTQTVESLDSLLHLTSEHTDMCHLDYYHRETPGPAELTECAPYKDNACCEPPTVRSAQTIKEAYGQKYHWDRCGPLSPQCERYFVEEACFYECEPAAGHYRRYPATPSATVVDEHVRPEFESQCDSYSENYNATADCSHNSWELFQMPIKASYCDAWYEACADDFFCASEGGDFFSCAAEYEECDEGQGNHFAIGSPDDGDKTSSGDGEGGTSVGMAWTSAANLVVALTAVAFVAIV